MFDVNISVGNIYALRSSSGSGSALRMQTVDTKAIGKRLKDARDRAGLTQAALAEAAGIVDETVSRIERGAFEPALSTAAALADALGISLDSLAGRSAQSKSTHQGSPLVRRLSERAALLEPAGVSALLRVAKRLPTRLQKGMGKTPKAR